MVTKLSPPWRLTKDIVFILAGIGSAGMGLKGFLLSSHFIDGGVTGISMLIANTTTLPLSVLILLINLPFVALGYRQIGRPFAIKSALAIVGLSIALEVIPYPDVTPDLLLTAVFGGFFIGAGIGLAMRGGGVLDGTEVAALLISRSNPLLKVGDVIMLLNVAIFGAAAFFLSIESALYSMITYFAASKTVDFLIQGIEQYTAVLIVSPLHSAIQGMIAGNGWGVTVLKGDNGYGKRGDRQDGSEVLWVVVTRLELSRLMNLIDEIDEQAFVAQYGIDNIRGGKVKSLPLH